MDRTYIVLIDGYVCVFANKPKKSNFRADARLFSTSDHTPIRYLSDFFGKGYCHSRFREIKW